MRYSHGSHRGLQIWRPLRRLNAFNIEWEGNPRKNISKGGREMLFVRRVNSYPNAEILSKFPNKLYRQRVYGSKVDYLMVEFMSSQITRIQHILSHSFAFKDFVLDFAVVV